jgi:hypothetical protein
MWKLSYSKCHLFLQWVVFIIMLVVQKLDFLHGSIITNDEPMLLIIEANGLK